MTSKQRDTSAQPENAEAYQPVGLELRGNLSFRRLNPGAGVAAVKTGSPQLCGWIAGMAYAYAVDTKNSSYGEYTRVIGEFFAIPHDRSSEITGTEIFLPGIAERFVKAAIDKAGQCPIRFEGWAYPDNSARPGSENKYVYRIFVRQPPGAMSIARKMAIEAGIIAAPPSPPPLQIGNYDLETGELLPEPETKKRDGLTELLGEAHRPEEAPLERAAAE